MPRKYLFKELDTCTMEPTFEVLAHPSLHNHPMKGILHRLEIRSSVSSLVDLGPPSAGLESSRPPTFTPEHCHLSECRPKGIDPSGKCDSRKAELASVECPGTESEHTGDQWPRSFIYQLLDTCCVLDRLDSLVTSAS